MSDNRILDTDKISFKRREQRRRKLSRRKKETTLTMKKQKQRLLEQLREDYLNGIHNEPLNSNVVEEKIKNHANEQKKFLQIGLTQGAYIMINRIAVGESKSMPEKLIIVPDKDKADYPLQKTFVKVAHLLALNEIELLNLVIHFEEMAGGFDNKTGDLEFFLLSLALAVKQKVNDDCSDLLEYFQLHYPKAAAASKELFQHNKKFKSLKIDQKTLNTKYKEMTKPANPLCKNDFLDYNFIVDKILNLSLPYSENKGQEKHQVRQASSEQPSSNFEATFQKAFPSATFVPWVPEQNELNNCLSNSEVYYVPVIPKSKLNQPNKKVNLYYGRKSENIEEKLNPNVTQNPYLRENFINNFPTNKFTSGYFNPISSNNLDHNNILSNCRQISKETFFQDKRQKPEENEEVICQDLRARIQQNFIRDNFFHELSSSKILFNVAGYISDFFAKSSNNFDDKK